MLRISHRFLRYGSLHARQVNLDACSQQIKAAHRIPAERHADFNRSIRDGDPRLGGQQIERAVGAAGIAGREKLFRIGATARTAQGLGQAQAHREVAVVGSDDSDARPCPVSSSVNVTVVVEER